MKKFLKVLFSFICVLALACAFVACGEPDPEEPVEKEYKLGMGATLSLNEKSGQFDSLLAAVVVDAEGKIVQCRVDAIQNKVKLEAGTYTVVNTESKRELGSRYGMEGKVDNNGDGVMLEWYAQADAFEAWCVGKTGAEVAKTETQELNGHVVAKDEALLSAGCTIQITDFLAAVGKACADDQGATFKTASKFTLGLAANSSVDSSSKNATETEEGAINIYADFACAVVADGKILACLNDAVQPKVSFNAEGVTSAKVVNTKRCLKEDYNMSKYGSDNNGDGKVLEWYIQSELFSKFCVGKTAAEVTALQTQELAGHKVTVDADLLASGCTMQITSLQAAIAKAAKNAR